MALHRKLDALRRLRPDVAVLSECAEPKVVAERAGVESLEADAVWIGNNRYKGLAVFGFNGYRLNLDGRYRASHRFVAPVRVEGKKRFNLLAVWAQNFSAGITRKRQPGPMRLALRRYREFLTECDAVVAGDLKDNCIWDKPGWLMNHAHTVHVLRQCGMTSVYHHVTGEPFGEESTPTIYWRNRTKDGPTYHLDYVFAPDGWLEKECAIQVGSFEDWCGSKLSDHVPLVVDFRHGQPAKLILPCLSSTVRCDS